MSIDYLAEFPIPAALLPAKLKDLLSPVDVDQNIQVEVCSSRETKKRGGPHEVMHMLMAVVPEEEVVGLKVMSEASDGVVSFSVPWLEKKGDSRTVSPSVSGYDYVVASWGSGGFSSYHLAEKVWMTLGLTPRCLGNDEQKLVYDDLSGPVLGVAVGEVSAEYHWKASRAVSWRMSNAYLRKYLWMRGCIGVRSFFYEVKVVDHVELRALMDGKPHVSIGSPDDWFELQLREYEGELLLQVWATVAAVSCELSPEQSSDGLVWPGCPAPVSRQSANAMVMGPVVYLDDRFLTRYEQSQFYDTVPGYVFGQWSCSPSYRGQWSFSDCVRVGRNAISVPLRELYKPKPDSEILHAHAHVLNLAQVEQLNHEEEHVVNKTSRLLNQLLELGDNLSALGKRVGIDHAPERWVGLSREQIAYSGWSEYPQLSKLAQTAPLDMSQQAFLARCKGLHEIWQKVPDGLLRKLVEIAGCPKQEIEGLRTLKLLEILLNLVQGLDARHEGAAELRNTSAPEGWSKRNADLAPLFLTNDLRIADAHEAVDKCLTAMQKMGLDTAGVHQGYGRALDFVFDRMIDAFESVNAPLRRILGR